MKQRILAKGNSVFALSQNQVMSLVQADWNEPDCPIKLNDNLPLDVLQGAVIISHARLFLSHLNTDKGIKLTAAGNLNRKFIELGQCAEKKWRKLSGFNYLAKVITGVKFKDGLEVTKNNQAAA